MGWLRSAALVFAGVTVLPLAPGCGGEVIRLGVGASSTGHDGGACPHAQVPASQVLWIGDVWQLLPAGAEPHTDVRNFARAARAIGPNDDYTIAAVAAAPMVPPATKGGPAPVPSQYTSQEAIAPVKVLIVDGGTWDTIANSSSATVTGVANAFTQLLSTVASDGTVTAVIYFLMPELSNIPDVAQMRPLLEKACAASSVPCHFIDSAAALDRPNRRYDRGRSARPDGCGLQRHRQRDLEHDEDLLHRPVRRAADTLYEARCSSNRANVGRPSCTCRKRSISITQSLLCP